MAESKILYEKANLWIEKAIFGTGRFRPKSQGYIIWQQGATHSIKKATIGYPGADGLRRAIEAIDRILEGKII